MGGNDQDVVFTGMLLNLRYFKSLLESSSNQRLFLFLYKNNTAMVY